MQKNSSLETSNRKEFNFIVACTCKSAARMMKGRLTDRFSLAVQSIEAERSGRVKGERANKAPIQSRFCEKEIRVL